MALDFAQEATALVDHFSRGRIDKVAQFYAFPAVLYIGPDVLVLWEEADLRDFIETYRGIMLDRGLDHVASDVIDTTKTEKQGFAVTVRNTFYNAQGTVIGESAVRYFLQRENPCLRIRLVEYLEWPFRDDLAASAAYQRLKP